ncbi:class I SAM-dependent methyltransferase [Peribacillus sp. B-H-3]|uniref:class I SAM-dependent methyltransferase n=1 Tax=Peribacillus sp. B-H-3 TaxID=3400420 RepID=UPI003B021835
MNLTYQDVLAFYGIEGAHPGGFGLTKKILAKEKISDKTTVLDAGCGTGQTASYLFRTFSCPVTAIDKHPEMIKKALQRFKHEKIPIQILQSSMEAMPFDDGSFDYIIAESSIAFTNINNTLRELYRVLKTGGVLLHIDMTAEPSLKKEEKAELKKFYQMKEIFTEKEWLKAHNLANFKGVQILKSNTILKELEEMPISDFANMPPAPQEFDEIMHKHQLLTLSHGDKLGYRAFRAVKSSSLRSQFS